MRSGFTWLELLLATSVAAVFLALAQGPLQHFSSLLTDQYTTSAKQHQLDRFLLMLKVELIQAGYALGDDAEPVQVSYRFRSADKRLQRRSGSGSYQTLVEEVGAISFALGSGRDLPMSPPQHCVVVGVRLDPDAEDLSYTLCPIFL